MLYNETKQHVVLEDAMVADNFLQRFLGLMGKKSLNTSQGLLLINCGSIHTCFMRFPIDVVFLDMDYQVITLKEAVKPWRMVSTVKNAYITVEMGAGMIKEKGISVGDLLILR